MSDEQRAGIVVYSTSWCPDCVRAKAVMNRLNVPFTDIDIDRDRAGYQIPTIFFPDGTALVEPSNQALKEKLQSLGLVIEE